MSSRSLCVPCPRRSLSRSAAWLLGTILFGAVSSVDAQALFGSKGGASIASAFVASGGTSLSESFTIENGLGQATTGEVFISASFQTQDGVVSIDPSLFFDATLLGGSFTGVLGVLVQS